MLIVELRSPESGWASVTKECYTEEQWHFIFYNWPMSHADKKEADGFTRAYNSSETWLLRSLFPKTRMTYHEAQAFTDRGIALNIEATPSMMLTKMKGNYHGIEEPTPADIALGRVVILALPDIGLLTIDEVTWLDDACTEELQRKLDEGWRILAVCPPNAQQRPDYTLGRQRSKAHG